MNVEAWITGIGIVSCLGEGPEAHWRALAETDPGPVVDRTRFAPVPVHPLVQLDLDKQIPKRGDQRQMEPWQRIGTYTAGLALADAGIAGNTEILSHTDMIVAAGGGERDIDVDNRILADIEQAPEPEVFLNERLVNDLRPTLFLAQLPNLLAGNISIVHKVTGSSRTFMGEELAGVSALEIALKRIAAGQGEIALVGAAYNAERKDLMLNAALGRLLWTGDDRSVWARAEAEGGMILGSLGAFLVIESRRHAETRGRRPYARLASVMSARSRREPGAARAAAVRQIEALRPHLAGKAVSVLSGATGVRDLTREERDFLSALREAGEIDAIRAPASILGAAIEASFPALVALGALALRQKGFYRPYDTSGVETPARDVPESLILTAWGHWRGEGLALLERAEGNG
jgi:3-oxoacyl-[acyl-carrier-protein] synthase II